MAELFADGDILFDDAQGEIATRLIKDVMQNMMENASNLKGKGQLDLFDNAVKLLNQPEVLLGRKGLVAMGVLGRPKFMLLRTLYRTKKAPPGIYEGGLAPQGLKKKVNFLKAVESLRKEGYILRKPLNKKRSEWSLNNDKFLKNFGLSTEDMFSEREWITKKNKR